MKSGFVSRADKKRRSQGLRSLLPQGHEATFPTCFGDSEGRAILSTLLDGDDGSEASTAQELHEELCAPIHVDDFIDNRFLLKETRCEHTDYARWMFNHWRLPAADRMDFDEFMEGNLLFCMYEGEKHRVTGCSRMGDIWLTLDFSQDCGYQKRVNVEDCLNWSKS